MNHVNQKKKAKINQSQLQSMIILFKEKKTVHFEYSVFHFGVTSKRHTQIVRIVDIRDVHQSNGN